MRVGYDVAPLALNQAGERRYAAGLLAALHDRGDVTVEELTLARRRPGGMAQRVAYQLVAETLYYPLLVGRQARARGVDLVHHPRHLVPPALGMNVPTLVTVHDVLPLSDPDHFSALIRTRYRPLTRAAVRGAGLVLTGSHHSAQQVSERLGVPPERIRVTPYGVEPHFRQLEPDSDWLRDRFGIGSRYLLAVGTLESRKNLLGALRAFRLVARELPDVLLVLAGGRGWRNEDFEEELRRDPSRVIRAGFVTDDELVRLYSGASCFLFPSLSEGFGFPVLEAMACGAPVVSSDRTSLPEVVGDAGVLVDPQDVEGIAGAVVRLLSDPAAARELRERGMERAARYSWRACAEATVAAYGELLAGRL